MEQHLLEILRSEILEADGDLTLESDLFAAGLDSMGIMQLLLAIEDHYQVAIEPADLSRENFATAPRIAAIIRSKQALP